MELKNILFDLGGVLLEIDYNRTTRAFQQLGFPEFERMYSQFSADELFQKLETGTISIEDFYNVLIKAHAREIDRQQILTAWNSMLLNWREESLQFLESISARYNIYLLSNTNALHFKAFHESLKEQTGRNSIDPLFKKAYWSHKINLRKPGREVFEFVLNDARIRPGESLFIDDSENNILMAAALGFRTCLLQSNMRVENLDYSFFL